ncbi:MAG: hypothetical protein C4325_14525 [Blastocatellia bacterium]
MRRDHYNQGTIFLLSLCFMALVTPAQKQTRQVDKPSECEYVRQALDESIFASINDQESTVIFILRKGRGEFGEKILSKRVAAIRAHLNFRKADPTRFVIAESDRTNGLGKLEIYIKGRLAWELFAARNTLFGFKCGE